jgi:Xaa-Pro aminopeptidase
MPEKKNVERIERIKSALQAAKLDALVCTLPENVLMLSGYWPVIGNAVALATQEGQVFVLAPEDERELARQGWADEVLTFQPASLEKLPAPVEAVGAVLAGLAKRLDIQQGRIGYESGAVSQPVTYAAMYLYGTAIYPLLNHAFALGQQVIASEWLDELQATLTPYEIERVRTACRVAGEAFEQGTGQLFSGLTETEAATLFRNPLSTRANGQAGIERADGFAWCMSGPNAALAFGAYARSRARKLEPGDLALVHCNSYVDGYWTDITRTYCLGEPDERKLRLYRAVMEARAYALETIRPGVNAAEVDRAAREVLRAHGFEQEFKHGTGHGVGFAAISAEARPRLHPKSTDVLQTGMVFNVEPALYFEGYGGLRHCDVIALTERGPEILTGFQSRIEQLVITQDGVR